MDVFIFKRWDMDIFDTTPRDPSSWKVPMNCGMKRKTLVGTKYETENIKQIIYEPQEVEGGAD